MNSPVSLITPTQCALLLIDQQAGLAFGVGSHDRQTLLNNTIALARNVQGIWHSHRRIDICEQGIQRAPDASHSSGSTRSTLAGTTQYESMGGRCRSLGRDKDATATFARFGAAHRGLRLVPGTLCIVRRLRGLRRRRRLRWYYTRESSARTTSDGKRGSAHDVLDTGSIRATARLDTSRNL